MALRIFTPRRELRRISRQPILFFLGLSLAVVGNVFALRLFEGFDYFFGSIFSLMLYLRFGPITAISSAVIGALPVAMVNSAPWVPLIAAGEILFLTLIPIRRKSDYLVPLVALFWVAAAVPIFALLFPVYQDYEQPLLFALNRLINGIANGVGATILHTIISDGPWSRAGRKQRFSYRSVIFVAMIAFVIVPSLFTLVATLNREVEMLDRRIQERTALVLRAANQSVGLRLSDYEHVARTLARAATFEETLDGESLGQELRLLFQADRWIRFAGTWDSNGELLLAYGDRSSAEGLQSYPIREAGSERIPMTLVRLDPDEPAEAMARLGILIVVPVVEEGEVVGGVGMVVDGDLLGHLLADLSTGWWITTAIVDEDNRVIGASSPGIDALMVLDEPLIPFNQNRLTSRVSIVTPGGSETNQQRLSPYEQSLAFDYKPSWRIVADTSLAPFRAELRSEALRSLIVVVLVLLPAMGLAALVSASLVSSLGKLHALTDSLSPRIDRSEEVPWPTSRIKEIHALIRRFRSNLQELGAAFSELRRTNARLEEASEAAKTASRAKSAFLANVSHELRTPLNAVLGYAQFLQSEEELKEEYREPVTTIRSSAEQLLEMIDDILEVSQLRNQAIAERWDIFDLRSLLEHVVRPFELEARASGLEMKMTLDPEIPHFVRADQKHLRRIVSNLLDNAIKFTEEGGITLTARMADTERLQILVEDTGIGIPEHHLVEIFAPFHQQEDHLTKKRSGAGLGLAIVQHLVTLMKGEIAAHSTPGKGTRFCVEVPVALVSGEAGDDGRGEGDGPRPEYLRALVQVAESGDVTHLRALIVELEREDPGGAGFYREALALADAFELDRLKELLKKRINGW
ncbi:MAG: sensor histidine kinase [Spirochaetaceae bacterium]